MKAITFSGIRKVKLSEVAEPRIENPGDALIKVERAAICGSDMHVYHGRETGIDVGTIMGHEFVGTVVETGSRVKNFEHGERVISPFTTNCGTCYYCKQGLTARCNKGQLYGWVENSMGLQGVHAEYVRVPLADTTLVHLPEDISWEEGNLLADIFSTGYFCAEMAEIATDGVYAVIGCGPVGQMAIKAAVMLGAKQLFAIDSIPFRLNMAKQNGEIPINFIEQDVSEVIMQATEGRGVDSVMEAVGGFEPMEVAFKLLRPGGILSTVGVQAYERFPFTPSDIYDKNLILKAGRCSVRYYLNKLIPFVVEKKVNLTDVITRTFELSEGVEAYRVFDEEKESTMKVLLKP